MITVSRFVFVFALAMFAGCATTSDPGPSAAPVPAPESRPVATAAAQTPPALPATESDYKAMTFGRGMVRGTAREELTFQFSVSVYNDERVEGSFRFAGQTESATLEIEADVSCVTLDHEGGRGWIAGRISLNDSTDSRYAAAVGSAVSFRILDRNQQQQQPLISLPLLQANDDSARRFCDQAAWREQGMHLVEIGALAIFP